MCISQTTRRFYYISSLVLFIFVESNGESNDNDGDDYVMNDYLKMHLMTRNNIDDIHIQKIYYQEKKLNCSERKIFLTTITTAYFIIFKCLPCFDIRTCIKK